jgi:hypothetical protein
MIKFQSLIIEQTLKTPLIELNHLSGELIFSGKSIPENAAKVYEPVFNWVKEYSLSARPTTNLRINLEYFNTASSLWLAKILKVLCKINEPEFTLIIHLYIPIEEYDEMKDFEDLKDVFFPISDMFHDAKLSIGIKLYGTDEDGTVIKDTLVFV